MGADISKLAILTLNTGRATEWRPALPSQGCHNACCSSGAASPCPAAAAGDRVVVVGSPFGASAVDFFTDWVAEGIISRADPHVGARPAPRCPLRSMLPVAHPRRLMCRSAWKYTCLLPCIVVSQTGCSYDR